MGLFDFAKDLGEKLFNRDEKAADKIKDRIEASNPGIKNLEVDFDDGVVTLSGEAKDAVAMQKAVLIAGNVKGVEEVKLDDFELAEVRDLDSSDSTTRRPIVIAAAEKDVEYYTIERGDTLSKIAKRYYGDAMEYPRIFEANREVIKDPDLIYPGQKIRIPKQHATV
ncbi:MAG: peptidoglycan-binding protein LysM [Gammaproteobacteria bacterium]|nr:peptidoglycan-binding protein LysM [Gammaproteobacteria bacterium]